MSLSSPTESCPDHISPRRQPDLSQRLFEKESFVVLILVNHQIVPEVVKLTT
jgi:hypothetical protein